MVSVIDMNTTNRQVYSVVIHIHNGGYHVVYEHPDKTNAENHMMRLRAQLHKHGCLIDCINLQ